VHRKRGAGWLFALFVIYPPMRRIRFGSGARSAIGHAVVRR